MENEILVLFLQLSASGILYSLAAFCLGLVVFNFSKSELIASLSIIVFYLFQFNPATIYSTSGYIQILFVVVGAYLLNLLVVLIISNILFKSSIFVKKNPKKSCKNKYPSVTTKNRFNKRSLYRLSK